MEEDRPLDLRRVGLGVLGALLLAMGVGIGIWAVSVIGRALYHPAEIPLIGAILERGDDIVQFPANNEEGAFTMNGSGMFISMFLVVFLIMALGAIVNGLITGGVNLLSDSAWGVPAYDRRARRRRRGRGETE